MKREASAVWRGEGKSGKGELTTASGVLKGTQYSFATRFENGVGTNPEELIGAAHAGCYSMALAFALGAQGFKPDEIRTSASVSLDKDGDGWAIGSVHLTLQARIPEIKAAQFQEIAAKAKEGCPVSKVLKAKITLDAQDFLT